jgi:inosine-uridine nucleoside N-ribohydrolase
MKAEDAEVQSSMNLIVETDIGRDPDDVFALLYLVQAGAQLRGITVSPGDRDQIALLRWLLAKIGVEVPVGAARFLPDQRSLSAPHERMLEKDNVDRLADADGPGVDILEATLTTYPDCAVYCCGPMKSLGAYLERHHSADNPFRNRVTVQGGFIGYDVHGRKVERLDKFEDKNKVATFNLGGCKKSSLLLLERVKAPHFIGKNLCHTITYTRAEHARLQGDASPIYALFHELMEDYLATQDEKVLHDVIAAVGHWHPEYFDWFAGELYREQGEYGTRPSDNPRHLVAVDVERQRLWDSILHGY